LAGRQKERFVYPRSGTPASPPKGRLRRFNRLGEKRADLGAAIRTAPGKEMPASPWSKPPPQRKCWQPAEFAS
jgi:hypothetical protein